MALQKKELIVEMSTTAIEETLDMQPEELRKTYWHTLGQGGGCDTKNKDVPEEVTLAKSFT